MSAESDLIERVGMVVGYIPHGLGDLLHVLIHPDVIHLTEAYVREQACLSSLPEGEK